MTARLRIIIGMVALLAIILVVSVFVINHSDLSRHKHRIEQLVLDKTGRDLQIAGPIFARVFPWVGVKLHDVALGNASEFPDTEFATAVSSEIQLELLPLLMGNFKLKSVQLHGLSLHLKRSEDGKTNWDDLMSTTAVVETETEGDVVQEVEAGTPLVAALSIGGLNISDSSFSFIDDRDSSHFALNDIHFSTGTIGLTEPFGFDAQFTFVTSDGAGIASEVSASGDMALNLADNEYLLSQLQVSTVNVGGGLPVEQLPVNLEGDLIARLNAQTIDLTLDSGSVLGIPIRGEIQVDGLQEKGWLTGTLESGDFNFTKVLEQLDIEQVESEPANKVELTGNLTARFVKYDDQLKINKFKAIIGNAEVDGNFHIANLSGSSVLSGEIQTGVFNPASWVEYFDLPLATTNAMQTGRFAASVRQSGQLLAFNQLSMQLDDSTITGDIEIADIKASVPPVNFALLIDQIDLDRYLLAEQETTTRVVSQSVNEGGDSAHPGTDGDQSELLPVQLLRELTLSGEVSVGQLTLAGVSAQNIVVPMTANGGKLEVTEAKAELHKGSFNATATLDAEVDEPLLTITGNLNGVSVEPLMKEYSQSGASVTGIANINIDLLSRGMTRQQLLERANGAVSARITDGVINGIDIRSELQRATGVSLDSVGESSLSTPFSELSVSGELADGLLQSDDLVFVSESLGLSGEGSMNLAKQVVDYLLHIKVQAQNENGSQVLQALEGFELSVPVRGSFSDLSVDMNALLLQALKTGLVDHIRQRKDSLLENSGLSGQIEVQKAALRERLEKERENVAQRISEKKQLAQPEIDVLELDAQQKFDNKKEVLKEKLQDNLIKGLEDVLGEN